MSQTVAALLEAAMALPEEDRAELTELLALSLTSSPNPLHPDWAAELHRRAAEIDSGEVELIPWDEVRRQVQAKLDAGGPSVG